MARQPEGTPDAAATSALEQPKSLAPEFKLPAAAEVKAPSIPEVAIPEIYAIAENRSITTLRGMLHAGEIVSARDFPGGTKALAQFVAAGSVVKR